MLRIKAVEVGSGILAAASVAILLGTQACSRIQSDQSAAADVISSDQTVSTTAPPATMMADGTVPQGGALVQTLAIPGTGGDVIPTHLALTVPANSEATGVVPATGVASPGRVVPVITTVPMGASAVVKSEVKRFFFHSPQEEARYNKAAAKFPDFCHEWQRMLRDRESNNLSHLTWQTQGGVQTTTYTGYGEVDDCETKESVEGVPIGKISYMEMIYNLTGKTPEEARHAPPKMIHQTHTLEIFSWEKDKWFY